jgi:hypothetical protein
MPKKKWTSRRIARDIIILLVVLSTAVIAPVAYLASQARQDISEQFIQNATSQAVSQFLTMSGSIEATLGLVRDWGSSEALSIAKTDVVTSLLFPIFGREKMLAGISIADIEGNSFHIYRADGGYRSNRVSDSGKERVSEITCWDEAFQAAEHYSTNTVYDPRNRPWFAPALTKDEISWTDPYAFFTSGEIGITASTSYVRKKDDKQVVIAFDVLVDDLFKEMHLLAPSDNSLIYIFHRDASLYVPKSEKLQAAFVPIGDAGSDLVRKVHANWFGDQHLSDKVISVMHEGQLWWCGFRPLDPDRKTTWIAVMVPERDILGHAGQRSKRLWFIGLASIFIATGLAVWMVRRYGRPNAATETFDRAHPQESIRAIIAEGENRYVEFKSTMRMNLHTEKPGKEIEMAWMKGVAGFLNTDGGILLIGVTDEGEITGLERDVFENDDKCRLHFKNLISKHIGADLSKYIRFIMVPMDGKTVGVVRCDRASEPVFVKDGNKEHFYIRNGPSSDELPVSQALNYIKHRQ